MSSSSSPAKPSSETSKEPETKVSGFSSSPPFASSSSVKSAFSNPKSSETNTTVASPSPTSASITNWGAASQAWIPKPSTNSQSPSSSSPANAPSTGSTAAIASASSANNRAASSATDLGSGSIQATNNASGLPPSSAHSTPLVWPAPPQWAQKRPEPSPSSNSFKQNFTPSRNEPSSATGKQSDSNTTTTWNSSSSSSSSPFSLSSAWSTTEYGPITAADCQRNFCLLMEAIDKNDASQVKELLNTNSHSLLNIFQYHRSSTHETLLMRAVKSLEMTLIIMKAIRNAGGDDALKRELERYTNHTYSLPKSSTQAMTKPVAQNTPLMIALAHQTETFQVVKVLIDTIKDIGGNLMLREQIRLGFTLQMVCYYGCEQTMRYVFDNCCNLYENTYYLGGLLGRLTYNPRLTAESFRVLFAKLVEKSLFEQEYDRLESCDLKDFLKVGVDLEKIYEGYVKLKREFEASAVKLAEGFGK